MASNVILTGFKELETYLDKLSIEQKKIAKKILIKTGTGVKREYRKNLKQSGNYKTGDLDLSIYKETTGLTTEIGSDSGVSRLIEYGSRPHKITVKNSTVLTDGVDFFGKVVNHPGYKGNPALTRAFFKIVGLNGRKIINRMKVEFSKVN